MRASFEGPVRQRQGIASGWPVTRAVPVFSLCTALVIAVAVERLETPGGHRQCCDTLLFRASQLDGRTSHLLGWRASLMNPEVPTATERERNPPGATFENAYGLRWHFRIPSAKPSTGIPCARHTRWRRRPGEAASVPARLRAGADTSGPPADGKREATVPPLPKTRRTLPEI